MKTIKPAAYSMINDKKTNVETFVPDPTAKSIQYTDEELKILMDKKLIPKDLAQFEIAQINRMTKFFESWLSFKKNKPDSTEIERLEWFKNNSKAPHIDDLKKAMALFDYMFKNMKKLQQALTSKSNPELFAFPSHSLMLTLLALFSGKPEYIPRKILEKPDYDRTIEEKEAANKYINEIFDRKDKFDYSQGEEKRVRQSVALICDNLKVKGRAKISIDLFQKDLHFSEERLAMYIKRTFGPEGIRHLLALIVGLEENGRTGSFVWSINEHLERLGYKRQNNGSFDPRLKKTASKFIKIFIGLCITGTSQDGKKESINAEYLFMVGGFEFQLSEKETIDQSKSRMFQKEIINEKIKLIATECWYKNAISPKDGKAPKYTKLLKEIVKENHRDHPLTLYLAPLLAIFWRMNPERKLSVKSLLDWCNLRTDGKYWIDDLRNLESTLEYMKNRKYLGNWKNNGEEIFPSQCTNPLECILTLTPPDWLNQELANIQKKNEGPAITTTQKISHPQFLEILSSSGLSRKQFANSIDVTPRLITSIINGQRTITEATTKKVLNFLSRAEKKQEQNR